MKLPTPRKVPCLLAACVVALALAPAVPALSVELPDEVCDVQVSGWYSTPLRFTVGGVPDPASGSYYAEYRWYRDTYPAPTCDDGSLVCEVLVWDLKLVTFTNPPGPAPPGSHVIVGFRSVPGMPFPITDSAGWYKQIPVQPPASHIYECSLSKEDCGVGVSFVLIDGRSVLAEGSGCAPAFGIVDPSELIGF